MLGKLHLTLLLLSLATVIGESATGKDTGADGKSPKIPPPPSAPTVPTPMPIPGAAIPLPDGVELVVSHDSKCIVEAFPAGIVEIRSLEVKTGHFHTLSGTFTDPSDGGKVTDKDQTFAGPCFVYRIRGVAKGDCTVFIAVVGEDKGQRVQLAVQGPRPPPDCPGPVVDPVVPPISPFQKNVQDAYNLDSDYRDTTGKVWTKSDCANKLAAVYKVVGTQLDPDNGVKTLPWKNLGELFADLEKLSRDTLPAGAIPSVRKVVGTRLNENIKPTALKPVDRVLIHKEFLAVSEALKGVK